MHRLLQFGLLGVQHLAHRHHLSGGLRLHPRDLVHALIGELGGRLGFRRAAARTHDQQDDSQQTAGEQQGDHGGGDAGQHQRVDLGQAGGEWVRVHLRF